MYFMGQQRVTKAFALPTVLIASIVLLMVLAVSVTATAAVRTTLQNQYYVQLAQIAGESGVAYAKACLAANGNIPQWTDAKPLTPSTDCFGNQILSPTVKALVIAGGGSGGGTAGGGGGGGFQYSDSVPITATSYSIAVGAGGAPTGNSATTGNPGGNSIFSTITAIGGGGGGTHGGSPGGAGGSGGGGGMVTAGAAGAGGTGSQGNNGGNGSSIAGWAGNNGGGGGAGGPGTDGGNSPGTANGGTGKTSNITGSMVYYAAGGGGGEVNGSYVGTGGSGIGGNGQVDSTGTAGAANTGSGGGGGSYNGTYWSGGAGGSGVVIISYPVNSGIAATGGTITTSGGNKIHRFTSSGTFAVSSVGSSSCPSDPKCSVTINGNVRSSFSVPKPTVDSNGRAVTIPNSGYTQILRTSNGAVWRTYQQPSVQAAVVPDLCSGNATSARGWSPAVKTTQQDSLPSASTAQTISIADAAINAGQVFYRKDFNAPATASYDLNVYTSSAQDAATTYIDGNPVNTAAGSVGTSAVTLTAGCHVLVTKLVNQTYMPRASDFTASLTLKGVASPIIVTDPTWRVTAGDTVQFATNNYFEAPTAWQQSLDLGIWTNTTLPWGGAPANYASVSGDSLAEWITTQYSTGGLNRPADSFAWFRDPIPFSTATATTVRVTNYCDDRCTLYLDGTQVMDSTSGTGLISKSIPLQPGTHTFGIRLYNNSGGNVGALLFSAVDLSNNTVIARSSPNWDSTTSWQPSSMTSDLYSFDGSYAPTPAIQPSANAKLLVVGGGGGGGSDMGGGGGGGAVIYNAAYALSPGTYGVTVGSGGNGAAPGISQARGTNGGTSLFGTVRAIGGGGGGSEYSTSASPPGAGASAGGSAGCNQNLYASYVIGLGFGSAGTPGCYYPTGGGGAGGPGATNPATGGVGVPVGILGTSYYFGGGGGGAGYTPIGGNGGNGGGGGGAVGATTGGSGLNPGSAGGGGVQVAQTNTPGGNGGQYTGGGGGGGSHYNSNNKGGNGGSGVVIVSFPVGTMSVSLSGSYVDISNGYAGFYSGSTPGFTTYAFYGNGSFTVNSIGGGTSHNVNLLAVGGGGGGGVAGASGGGGGGGVISTTQNITTTGSYPVVVGAGGSGVGAAATNGADSTVFSFTAVGGGAGVPGNGASGGSGGGSARGSSPANYAAPGTPGQGYSGGSAGFNSGQYPAAGGGGAGGPGASVASASPGTSGAGGPGLASSISGVSVTYAGGGGGGGDYGCSRNLGPGAGGTGGGGAGGNSVNGNGVAGTPNTGSGGGGATQLSSCSATGVGGAGGSGVVIISYLTGTLTASGGTITTANGYTIHTFTSNGTFLVAALN
jgi:hypothetical protein